MKTANPNVTGELLDAIKMTHIQDDCYTNRSRQAALDIRSQCAVGDIVTRIFEVNLGDGRPVKYCDPRLAMITHIPEDESISNACKIVWLEDLGACPMPVSFNDIRPVTEEEL